MKRQNKLKPILIWGYNKILRNKRYKRKEINLIFNKIEQGKLKENYIWDCPKLTN